MKLLAGGKAVGFISQSGNEKALSSHTISCHITFSDTIVVPEYCQMQLSAFVEGRHLNLDQENNAILEPEANSWNATACLLHTLWLVVISRKY